MKPSILQVCLVVMFSLLCLSSKSQTFKASYEYDENGNRTKVTIVYLKLKSATVKTDSLHLSADSTKIPKNGWEESFPDYSGDFTAVVYPNPVHSLLLLELSNYDPQGKSSNSIKVWNMQGVEVYHVENPDPSTQINFSGFKNGTYILKVSVNNTVKTYKVIKE